MDKSITDYLLGRLSPTECAEVERRMFTDPGFLESIEASEEELIRDELAGVLPANERSPFHSWFLSFPDLHARYEFTKALRHALPATSKTADTSLQYDRVLTPEKSRLVIRFGRVAALAALAAFIAVGLDDLRRWHKEFSGRESPSLTAPSFVLTPGVLRSGNSRQTKIVVPPQAALIRLKLEFERSEHYDTFEIALKAADSDEPTLRFSGMKAQMEGTFQSIVLELPVSLLSENNYALSLKGEAPHGAEEIEGYSFAILNPEGK